MLQRARDFRTGLSRIIGGDGSDATEPTSPPRASHSAPASPSPTSRGAAAGSPAARSQSRPRAGHSPPWQTASPLGSRQQQQQHQQPQRAAAAPAPSATASAAAAAAAAAAPKTAVAVAATVAAPQPAARQQQQQHHAPAAAAPKTAAAAAATQQHQQQLRRQQQVRRATPPPGGAAAAPRATDDEPAIFAPQHDFRKAWLGMQHVASARATYLRIVEVVMERATPADPWQPPRRRTIALALNSHPSTHGVTDPDWIVAQTAAVKASNGELARHSSQSEKQLLNRRKAYVSRWGGTIAVELDEGSGRWQATGFSYGRFPLLIPTETSSCTLFRSTYESMSPLATDDPAGVPSFDVPDPGPAAMHAALRWTASFDTSDDVVDSELAQLGGSAALVRRVADGAPRLRFSILAAEAISGYSDPSTTPEKRDRLLRHLLALPRMHLKRLTGSASPELRSKFMLAQLSGSVCTERVDESADGAHRRIAHQRSAEEHLERCIKTAHALMSDGHPGRAHAALMREQVVAIPHDVKLAALAKLHPEGPPPTRVHLPPQRLFGRRNVEVDKLRATAKRGMTGSAPGPDGWTFELLYDALTHEQFAADFSAIVVDVCNGDVAPRTAQLLSASSLVALPKGQSPADGVRPIALGSVVHKVAATTALAAARSKLKERFGNSQFGCSSAGGAEFIVHAVRRFVRNGAWPHADRTAAPRARCVVALDFSNAFNTPLREAMWQATSGIPELHGVFAISYREPSTLHVVGSTDELVSARGARQGTVDGPVVFALTLQDCLDAANKLPGVCVVAYLDDVTICAASPQHAEAAVEMIRAMTAAKGMSLNARKCEVLVAEAEFDVPLSSAALPNMSQFKRGSCLKLLGASIGRTDVEEAAHLMAREGDKTVALFKRLRLNASPQFFSLLRQCVIPKLAHAIRVHAPAVSRDLCVAFDERVTNLIGEWAQVAMGPRERLITALNRALGGWGLTQMSMVAPAAYHASVTTALAGKATPQRPVKQGDLAQLAYRDAYSRETHKDPYLQRHLQQHALDGADAGLSCTLINVQPAVYGALLRTYLAADAVTVPEGTKSLICPGCKHSLDVGGPWGQHVANCVRLPGGHTTRRHNAAVHLLRVGHNEAGCMTEPGEPRDLATYACRCGLTFGHDGYREHRIKCSLATRALHVSGPDLRWTDADKTYVGDVTIINSLVTSNASSSAEELFAEAREGKFAKYGHLCQQALVELKVFAATANGHLDTTTVQTLHKLAKLASRDKRNVCAKYSATIAAGSAVGRLAAESNIGMRPAAASVHTWMLALKFAVAPEPADDDTNINDTNSNSAAAAASATAGTVAHHHDQQRQGAHDPGLLPAPAATAPTTTAAEQLCAHLYATFQQLLGSAAALVDEVRVRYDSERSQARRRREHGEQQQQRRLEDAAKTAREQQQQAAAETTADAPPPPPPLESEEEQRFRAATQMAAIVTNNVATAQRLRQKSRSQAGAGTNAAESIDTLGAEMVGEISRQRDVSQRNFDTTANRVGEVKAERERLDEEAKRAMSEAHDRLVAAQEASRRVDEAVETAERRMQRVTRAEVRARDCLAGENDRMAAAAGELLAAMAAAEEDGRKADALRERARSRHASLCASSSSWSDYATPARGGAGQFSDATEMRGRPGQGEATVMRAGGHDRGSSPAACEPGFQNIPPQQQQRQAFSVSNTTDRHGGSQHMGLRETFALAKQQNAGSSSSSSSAAHAFIGQNESTSPTARRPASVRNNGNNNNNNNINNNSGGNSHFAASSTPVLSTSSIAGSNSQSLSAGVSADRFFSAAPSHGQGPGRGSGSSTTR